MRRARGARQREARLLAHVRGFHGPPSQVRALLLVHEGSLPRGTEDRNSRYEVQLLDEDGEPLAAFRTSGFWDPDRVDLEDAFELGDFAGLVVRRRRGSFTPKEAARCLREIVEDLTYEDEHSCRVLVLQADRRQLRVAVHADLEDLVYAGDDQVLEGLVALLDLHCFDPVIGRSRAGWVELAFGPRELRRRLLVPLETPAANPPPAALLRGKLECKVVAFPGVTLPARSRAAASALPLRDLIAALHEARVDTLERSLLAGR